MPSDTIQKKKTYTQHPFEERMRAIELYRQGNTSKRIAALMGLDDSMIRAWIRKWKAYGADALQPYRRGVNLPLASSVTVAVKTRTSSSRPMALSLPPWNPLLPLPVDTTWIIIRSCIISGVIIRNS